MMSKKTVYQNADPSIDPVTGVVMDGPPIEVIDHVRSKLPTRGFAPLIRREVIARHADDGRTQDWYREESDINRILETFKRSNDPSVLMRPGANPQYVDLPEGLDYQAAMIQVSKAESAFMDLPSKLRAKFENDPRVFLDALNDPAQRDFFVKEGVLKPLPVPPQPEKIEGAPPPLKTTPEAPPPAS